MAVFIYKQKFIRKLCNACNDYLLVWTKSRSFIKDDIVTQKLFNVHSQRNLKKLIICFLRLNYLNN